VPDLDLQEQIIADAGKQMAKEIDFQILCGFLEELGWTKVILSPMTKEQGDAIDYWTQTQLTGNFENMGLVWVFEDKGDAINFTLKWK
jgi:hypothetical protein